MWRKAKVRWAGDLFLRPHNLERWHPSACASPATGRNCRGSFRLSRKTGDDDERR